MKTYRNLIFIALLFIGSVVIAQHTQTDEDAIKKVIQTAYVEGLQNEGDLEKIDSGIHPGFHLLGIGKENEMWTLPIAEWKERTVKKLENGQYPKTGKNAVSIKFLNIDITGTAAMAKIEFYVGVQLTYIDYISLYKFGENWKMVNKIFYKL